MTLKRRNRKKYSKKMWGVIDREGFYRIRIAPTKKEALKELRVARYLYEAYFQIIHVQITEL